MRLTLYYILQQNVNLLKTKRRLF